MDVAIRVEGARELASALRRAGDAGLLDALKTANLFAAEIAVDEANPKIPTRSGRLRSQTAATATASAGKAQSKTAYAAAIHWGRKRGNVGRPPGNHKGPNPIKGRPFLWDAAQRSVPRIEPEYRDEIMRIIDVAVSRARGL